MVSRRRYSVNSELKVIRSRRQGVRELNQLAAQRAQERRQVTELITVCMNERRQMISMLRLCLGTIPRWRLSTRRRVKEFLARVDPRAEVKDKSSGSNGQAQGGKES
jgi:hypothetical protein